jgi:hypothetical protein
MGVAKIANCIGYYSLLDAVCGRAWLAFFLQRGSVTDAALSLICIGTGTECRNMRRLALSHCSRSVARCRTRFDCATLVSQGRASQYAWLRLVLRRWSPYWVARGVGSSFIPALLDPTSIGLTFQTKTGRRMVPD